MLRKQNVTKIVTSQKGRMMRKFVAPALLALTVTANLVLAQVVIDQRPLIVAENVPGNLVLTPSVEWPTINSIANIETTYSTNGNYSGYFDSNKCYAYQFSDNEPERHFFPVSITTNGICNNTGTTLLWSGRYLNWVATQTIDPFRKALTGGLRVRDTPTETWLEKARHDGQGGAGVFPNRELTSDTIIRGATPFNGVNGSQTTINSFRVRVHGLGSQINIVLNGTNEVLNRTGDPAPPAVIPYNPAVHGRNNLLPNQGYALSVRVRVCVENLLEPNCVRYSNGWKPEGLIQEYAERLRFSIFGYLNDSSMLRDGAVLRGSQKFVGAREFDPTEGWRANTRREWDPVTGVLIRNPDPADALATRATNTALNPNIQDSGIINYLNKFGQMTDRNHKNFDPVSEMYYAALRYIRGLSNVPEYSSLNENSIENNYRAADGFPVITAWDDPYQYWCQQTAILGIGDTNTHRDKNLPGNSGNRAQEPTIPSLVLQDTDIDVMRATRKVFELEGITDRQPESGNGTGDNGGFSGRQNSAFIAGLAYHARTVDLRNDLRGRQTVATFWVDVLENQVLQGRTRNQYWLAAKYGGFRVPEGYDPYANTQALPQEWWSRTGERLVINNQNRDIRPDNFFIANDANRMIQSLRQAFEQVEAEQRRSGASLAANSTRLETGTAIYQSIYKSGTFGGDLLAFSLDPTSGRINNTLWQASQQLPGHTNRNIRVNLGTSSGNAPAQFNWASANNSLRSDIQNALGMSSSTVLEVERTVNYIRGDRSQEQPNGNLRRRTDLIGSIINSQPVLVGSPTAGLYSSTGFTGANAYSSFVTANANRTPMIYVGSNDGMLHGFNANTGVETFAFIPRTVLGNNLREYTLPDFTHRFFLDGEITVADAFINVGGGQASWRTVLVATLGRGGRGVFALDVTNPNDIRFMWEINSSTVPQLGNSLGKPIIAQVSNGEWRVLVGNGPNSTGNQAQLLSIRLNDGSVTAVNTAATGSIGLSSVFAWDGDNDGFVETAYAGDLNGGVWRFSNLGGTPSVNLLFQAIHPIGNTPQPITASPIAARNPDDGRVWVFFGTGQYLNTSDLSSISRQTWYGLIDGTTITSRNSLEQIGFVGDISVPGQDLIRRVLDEGVEVTGSSRGWYFDLPVSGERMVLPNQIRGRVLLGTTRIPDINDRCAPTGRGFIMAVDPFKGGRLPATFFDVNLDGFINPADTITVNGVQVFVSGIGLANAPFNPIFTGNVMQVNREDGTITQILTSGALANEIIRRTSWREIRR